MADTDPNAVHLQTAVPPKAITPEQGNINITGTVTAKGLVFPDPRGIIIPDGSLDFWNAAKAAGGIIPVSMVGDSILDGGVATDWIKNRFGRVLCQALKNVYGDNGTFYQANDQLTVLNAVSGVAYWTVTATGATWSSKNWCLGRTVFLANTQTAGSAIFTSDFAFTDADVYYHQEAGGGTFNLLVDGAVVANLTFQNATSTEKNVYQLRGLAATTHTVELRSTQATSEMHVQGIFCYTQLGTVRGVAAPNKPGIQEWIFASPGMRAMDVMDQYSGANAGTATFNGWHAQTAGIGAKLLIVQFGLNEANGTTSEASLRSNQADALDQARLAGCSAVYVAAPVMSGAGVSSTMFKQYPLYVADYLNLYAAESAATVSFLGLMGSTPSTYLTLASVPHPNDAGHLFMGNTLISFLR